MNDNEGFVCFTSELLGLTDTFEVNPSLYGTGNYYTQYLKRGALDDYALGLYVTHVYVKKDEADNPIEIIGYVTLRTSSLTIRERKNQLGAFPALEIYMLAVDAKYERQGYGSILIQYTLAVAGQLRENHAGVQYIVVCADQNAVPFYAKNKFVPCSDLYTLPLWQRLKSYKRFPRGRHALVNVNMQLGLP